MFDVKGTNLCLFNSASASGRQPGDLATTTLPRPLTIDVVAVASVSGHVQNIDLHCSAQCSVSLSDLIVVVASIIVFSINSNGQVFATSAIRFVASAEMKPQILRCGVFFNCLSPPSMTPWFVENTLWIDPTGN